MPGRTLVVAALMCWSASAAALETLDEIYWPETGKFPAYPYEPDTKNVRFSVFGGYDHDTNPFRLSDSDPTPGPRSDSVYRLGAGVRAELPAGRQRFLLEAKAQLNDYHRFNLLDHTSYGAGATWRWEVGNQWSGDAGYARRRYLGSLDDIQAPVKDMITEDRFFVSGGYLFTPRWRIRGAAEWLKWNHDDPIRSQLDARIWSGTAGLDYVTPANNTIGGQIKYSEGEYPNQQLVAPAALVVNDYKEWEASMVMRWIVTGKSTLDARLGYTVREHEQVPQRDFDGFTGRVGLDWFVANKTLLNFAVWHEIRSTDDASASYVLSEGWSVGPVWAPTTKLVFQARYLREDRDFKGDPGLVLTGAPPREDTFRGISLTGGWTPLRNIHLSLGVEWGDRSSNVLLRDFDYRMISANGRFRF
jgi:exopolysaccharide biosynthesis operon protein EpsL